MKTSEKKNRIKVKMKRRLIIKKKVMRESSKKGDE